MAEIELTRKQLTKIVQVAEEYFSDFYPYVKLETTNLQAGRTVAMVGHADGGKERTILVGPTGAALVLSEL